VTDGSLPDYQVAAMLMAIFWRGLEGRELATWADAMTRSGDVIDLSSIERAKIDKHSTGGVGDKISIPLAPAVAACGVAVPMVSGRGLGHTGGTLDKLESIPGWQADVGEEAMRAQLESVGAVVCAAGVGLAPADKKLYALRDITGTVESIPLIASSIMSKKIAEGTSALVLDVKFGSGAFMQDPAQSRRLAETMVALGTDAGVATTALLTNMNVPLGLAIGNANEVRESVEVLAGGGPADVVELTLALAREMLASAGQPDADVEAALKDGRAMDTWRAMISAQHGDPDAPLPVAKETHVVTAERGGILVEQQALPFGIAAWRLGAGRARKEDPVQHSAGIDLHAKPGETVTKGQPLFTLSADEPARFARALEALEGAYRIGDAGDEILDGGPLIADRITA
jgi:thymidine phosphorylase